MSIKAPKTPLTPQQVAKYCSQAHLPTKCPHCDSESITYTDAPEHEGEQIWVSTMCEKCERAWLEVFRLAFIEDADLNDDPVELVAGE